MAEAPKIKDTASLLASTWAALKAVPVMIGNLGESGVERGQLWSYRLADGTRRRIGTLSNLAWPVVGSGGTIYVLQEQTVVRLDPAGNVTDRLGPAAEWVKLLAVTPDGIVGFVGYDAPQLTLMTLGGKLETLPEPNGTQESDQIRMLLMESRKYQAGAVRIETSARGGRGTDVMFAGGDRVLNVSDGGSARSGQPVLAPDAERILYIAAPP